MEKITSVKNQKIKQWKKLQTTKGRKEANQYIIEGEHLYLEAIKSGIAIDTVVVTERFFEKLIPEHQEEAIFVTEDVMHVLTSTETSQGIFCVLTLPEQTLPSSFNGKFIILDGVQDPGNAGTIVRTADAAGFDGVFFGSGSVDPYNDKVVRSMQGSQFHIPIYRCNISEFIDKFEFVYGTALDERANDYRKIAKTDNVAIILGNEGNGVSSELLTQTTQNLYIPILGKAESLNVAIAGGIIMYHFV